MSLVLAVFEDARWRDLRPLTDAVPVPALAFGGSSLAERIARAARLPLASLVARADALTLCRTLPAATGVPDGAREGGVVVNAAALPGPWLESLVAGGTPELLRRGERLVGARLVGDALPKALARGTAIDQHLAG